MLYQGKTGMGLFSKSRLRLGQWAPVDLQDF